MGKKAAEKNTQNVVSVVERAFARAILGAPQLSGIFSAAGVPVYCSTDEGFAQKLAQDIDGSLGQTVRIAYAGREGIQFVGGGKILESARVNITVSSALLLADGKPESAISLADAIDSILTGAAFDFPFTSQPVVIDASQYGLDESNQRYSATLIAKCQFVLRKDGGGRRR